MNLIYELYLCISFYNMSDELIDDVQKENLSEFGLLMKAAKDNKPSTKLDKNIKELIGYMREINKTLSENKLIETEDKLTANNLSEKISEGLHIYSVCFDLREGPKNALKENQKISYYNLNL